MAEEITTEIIEEVKESFQPLPMMTSMPEEEPARILIEPVGAIARFATGLEMDNSSAICCTWSALGISSRLYFFQIALTCASVASQGIDSIIYHLKTDNFLRLKVGIATDNSVEPLKSYVLSPFQSKHKTTVALVLDNCVDAINFLLNNTVSETMNKYNKKNKENKWII